MDPDEELLLAVLNSAPILEGRRCDQLEGEAGQAFTRMLGGTGSAAERVELRRARDAIQSIVRGEGGAALEELSAITADTAKTPRVTANGVAWELQAPVDAHLAIQTVLAWSDVSQRLPGRVRACANPECNLFLIDHSKPGRAKWCSMAACGNRAKARSFAARARGIAASADATTR